MPLHIGSILRPQLACIALAAVHFVSSAHGMFAAEPNNLNDLPFDLQVPAIESGKPAAGKRVWQKLAGYAEWNVAHALYLPTDWTPTGTFPVIFEYPGNGNYQNKLGDRSTGLVEDCKLGYGISGGAGMIWVGLPFVDPQSQTHPSRWWGDPDATATSCRETVARICDEFGGDPQRLVLAGFSRGAIACNYIGLRDEETAKLWRAFICHSHYDGVRKWDYPDSDAESARTRLWRLGKRPQFISHEMSVDAVRQYLERTGVDGRFTFAALPYANHNADWALKDTALRQQVRQWLAEVLRD